MKNAPHGIGIMDKPPEPSPDEKAKHALTRIKNKIMIMSGKGGVGKSSVSVNLAIALAEKGFCVGLMDVDIHGPDIPRMLGLSGMMSANAQQKMDPMHYADNLKVVSIESLMPEKDDAIIWRGPMKHGVIRQFIGDVDWGALDYLIIDAPPGTGDEPLTVAQLIEDARAVIVTTPQEVALADVRKSINFCKTVKMRILGLVENMSGYVCPHCGETTDIFGSGGGERTAMQTGLKLLGRIPFDPNLVKCGDAGVSYQQQYADSPVSKAFLAIAGEITSASLK
jgi:Mrp family chromosome partitioning ATPase